MNVQLTLTVEVPQLEALTTTLQQQGAQLMATLDDILQGIVALRETIETEFAQVQALLQSDVDAQTKVDMAIAQLQDAQARIASMVPDAQPEPPPPPPEPEPQPEPPPAA